LDLGNFAVFRIMMMLSEAGKSWYSFPCCQLQDSSLPLNVCTGLSLEIYDESQYTIFGGVVNVEVVAWT
jgi:hypothetical protein